MPPVGATHASPLPTVFAMTGLSVRALVAHLLR